MIHKLTFVEGSFHLAFVRFDIPAIREGVSSSLDYSHGSACVLAIHDVSYVFGVHTVHAWLLCELELHVSR